MGFQCGAPSDMLDIISNRSLGAPAANENARHTAIVRWPLTVIPRVFFTLHVSTFARQPCLRAHVEFHVRT